MKNEALLKLIQTKPEKAFSKLYKVFPDVKKYVLANSGSKMEAEDIFQDGLIILYKKVNQKEFQLSGSLEGFLYHICKFCWNNEIRKKEKEHKLEKSDFELEVDLEELIQKENQLKQVENILDKLGEKCKEIIRLFYHKAMSMSQIAKKLDYRNEKTAKTQKYKCLERARNKVLEINNL